MGTSFRVITQSNLNTYMITSCYVSNYRLVVVLVGFIHRLHWDSSAVMSDDGLDSSSLLGGTRLAPEHHTGGKDVEPELRATLIIDQLMVSV